MAAILGFMPLLDRRLSMATRSGTAANVVPRPATKPRISDRCSRGANRLGVSRGTRSAQPANAEQLHNKMANVTLRNEPIYSGRCILRAAGPEFSAVRKAGHRSGKKFESPRPESDRRDWAGGSPNLYLPVPVEAGPSVGKISRPDEDPAGISLLVS
jgi:hypothetical protein